MVDIGLKLLGLLANYFLLLCPRGLIFYVGQSHLIHIDYYLPTLLALSLHLDSGHRRLSFKFSCSSVICGLADHILFSFVVCM